jgi:3-oxoadipate enol-lactonase
LPYSGIKGNYCPVNEGRLFFLKEGSGPPLVFIHGFCLDLRMWERQISYFSKKYTCIAFDVRGYGNSSVPTDQSYSNHEDLNTLLKFLDIKEPVILVGLSMGARVVANFALVYPEKTRAVIFVDGAIDGYIFKDFNLTYIYTAGKELGIPVANQMWLDHPIFGPTVRNENIKRKLTEMVLSYSGWHWINKNPIVNLMPPAIEQLHKLTMPALILVGQLDIPDFKALATFLNSQIAHSSFIEIAGAGHMSNMESPEIFNDLVNNFLNSDNPY